MDVIDVKENEAKSVIKELELKVKKFEGELCEKDDIIEVIIKRMDTFENKVKDKEQTIIMLTEKLKEIDEIKSKVNISERKIYVIEKERKGIEFCKYCEEEFEDSRKLEIHEIYSHTLKCEICDYEAGNKENLVLHLHTCEAYQCFTCGYTHKRLHELKTHCKTKHTMGKTIQSFKNG